jgi:TATA-box binding protein (TBP) (component of TFIID and TFIIIB)
MNIQQILDLYNNELILSLQAQNDDDDNDKSEVEEEDDDDDNDDNKKKKKRKKKQKQRKENIRTSMRITNIVSTAKPSVPLKLKDLCHIVSGKYSKSIFPAVSSKNQETKTTFVFFKFAVVNTGANSLAMSLYAWQLAAKIINQNDPINHITISNITITNIVTVCSLGYSLNMHKLDILFRDESGDYRGAVFPGMRVEYNKNNIKVTFIVFENGKVIAIGIKKVEMIPIVENIAFTIFESCKKNPKKKNNHKNKKRNRLNYEGGGEED